MGSTKLENLIKFVGTCLGKGIKVTRVKSVEIEKAESLSFLQEHCLERFEVGPINLALKSKGSLVAVLSLRKRGPSLVLSGFAVKAGVLYPQALRRLIGCAKRLYKGTLKITGKVSRDWCLELNLGSNAEIKLDSGVFYTDRYKSFSLKEKNGILRKGLEWKGQVFYPVVTSGIWTFKF